MANVDFTQPANITGIVIPEGARAVLVALNNDGSYRTQPVKQSESVLNLQRDLLLHLNEYPHSDEWLTQLRDYCDARLVARQMAKTSNQVIVPNSQSQWVMVDRNLPVNGGA